VKIKSHKIELNNWEDTGGPNPNWIRAACDGEFIGLMVSWRNYKSGRYVWDPMFFGKNLHSLEYIYSRFYPSEKPCIHNNVYYPSLSPLLIVFQDSQIEMAKIHIDHFLSRVNSLTAFL